MKSMKTRFLLSILLGLLAVRAWALINPNFTPADLVRGSTVILELRLAEGDEPEAARAAVMLAATAGQAPALP